MKIQKKFFFFFFLGGGGVGSGWGGQVGCDRTIEVLGKIDKKQFGWGGGGARGVRWGGSGWWGVRVDVNEELKFFVKIQKKIYIYFYFFWGGGGSGGWVGEGGRVGGVRVDVNEELKFFGKFTKKNRGGREGRGQVGGWFGGGGVRVDVNAMLGVGGDVGYGVCEPRIEVLYNVQKGIVQY